MKNKVKCIAIGSRELEQMLRGRIVPKTCENVNCEKQGFVMYRLETDRSITYVCQHCFKSI